MKRAKLILAAALAVVLIVLVVQNRGTVTTRFLWLDTKMPQAMLLLVTFLLGAASGLLAGSYLVSKARAGK